ncbi:MAG: 4Fe-4S dicluster domain-containing protein [Candidatus Schekmanbacteria bacterium]|nr:MAG: 4Fe-4S dicluster domain-containing protein [Candidatus Schekmanbacteria bacterium]
MASIFINVKIKEGCLGVEKCGECVKICPVNIFEAKDGKVSIVEKNEDECTLCDLCLQKCPVNVVSIEKLY